MPNPFPASTGYGLSPPSRFDERRRMQDVYARCRAARNWLPSEVIPHPLPAPKDERKREIGWALASQGVFTEQVGLLVAATLLQETEDLTARFALATAVSDEAKHSEAFARYATAAGGEVAEAGEPVQRILDGLYSLADPLDRFMVHTLLEGYAADEFALFIDLFDDDPLGEVYRYVRRDESRHVALGLVHLQQLAEDPAKRAEILERLPAVDEVCEEIVQPDALCVGLGRAFDIDGEALEASLRRKHQARLVAMAQPHPPEGR